MKRNLANEQLNQIVTSFGGKCSHLRQVSQRLFKLLPDRLLDLSREYRRSTTAGKADRRALADKRYEKFIEEYVEIKSSYLESYIIWETHRMMIDARKSMRAFHRP